MDNSIITELIKAYDEYIKEILGELGEVSGLVYVHGWRSSRVEKGKECRDKIAKLKKQLEKI